MSTSIRALALCGALPLSLVACQVEENSAPAENDKVAAQDHSAWSADKVAQMEELVAGHSVYAGLNPIEADVAAITAELQGESPLIEMQVTAAVQYTPLIGLFPTPATVQTTWSARMEDQNPG